jgi:hypothetical protein
VHKVGLEPTRQLAAECRTERGRIRHRPHGAALGNDA